MRLALNFPRIDPTRGGAETYVVDLCRSLVRAGHQVDLYAETLEGRLAAAGGPVHRRARAWPQPAAADLELRPQLRGGDRAGRLRLHRRVHQHVRPRRDHSPGRRARRQPASQCAPVPEPALVRRLYVLGKMLNPRYFVYRAIERRQYAPERQARVIAVSNMVRRHIQQFHHVPRDRDPRRAQRHRSRAGQGRPARGGPLRVPQPAGTGAGRPGRPVRGPQLRAQGLEAAAPGAWGQEPRRAPGRSTCWSAAAAAPDLIGGWPGRWGSTRPSISSATTTTSANASRPATSSSCRPIMIRARWWSWRPWPAGCLSSRRSRTAPAS